MEAAWSSGVGRGSGSRAEFGCLGQCNWPCVVIISVGSVCCCHCH